MANPHLSDCLEVTLHRLGSISPELKELEKLKVYFLAGTKVLADADKKAHHDEGVKRWLSEFQDASFQAENILEDLSVEVLRPKSKEVSRPKSKEVSRLPFGLSYRVKSEISKRNLLYELQEKKHGVEIKESKRNLGNELQEKMHGVVTLLEHLVGRIKVLGLRECGGLVEAQLKPRLHMSPLSHDRDFGREADKLALTNLLLSGDIYGTPNVISVSGMPGIGKTTLVEAVYNEESITKNFDLKIWIYVGQDFDVFRVTKEVLHKITSSAANTGDLDFLQVQLRQRLGGRRFLLVLDDFWSENSSEWELFRSAFTAGSEGSKIVLTTQSIIVTSITKAARTYQLKLMTNTESWELICSSVFGYKSVSSIGQELERVGKRIAEQCKGLPLAATTIASHLRSKPDDCEWWYDVSTNFLDYTSGVLKVFRRSYDSLACHLKRCFAFCSLFPKGYEFDRKNLVLLWMAVDLVYQPGSNKRLEDIGNKYLDDLVARSFLLSLDSKKRFTMHDFMNDLAKNIAGDFCFRLEDGSLVQMPERVRHISFCGKQWDSSVASGFTRGVEYLRTFLPLVVSLPRFGSSELAEKALDPMPSLFERPLSWLRTLPGSSELAEKALDPLPNFSEQALSCLRILSLSHYRITKLPRSFDQLKQLRYLNLSNTQVKELPEFVLTLRHLETLFLSNCFLLRRLTANIGYLINLRYLILLQTPLIEMPRGISNLRSLQRLSNFVIGKLGGACLQELSELSQLGGTLHISELQNVVSLTEASAAHLLKKPLLKKLVLTWNMETSGCNTIACEQIGLLEMLQPHPNLKRISINSYGGAIFPKWLGDTSFMNMTSVSLTSCSLCIFLPPLGQLPKLKYLSIEKFKILQKVGLEFFYGVKDKVSSLEPFPCLLNLSFYDMPRWEEWRCPELEGRIFPCLDKLTIKSCPSLTKRFPKGLPEFTQVTILESPLRFEEDCGENKELYRPEPGSSSQNYEDISSDAGTSSGEMMSEGDEDEMGFEGTKVTRVPELKEVSASMKRLHIEGCLGEKSLPESLLQDCPNLQELLVVGCHSLETLPGGYPSTSLKTLYIRDCMNLEFLESLQTMLIFPQLEDLFIENSCSTLCSFPLALFPNLISLSLRHCEKLSSFTVTLARGDVCLSLETLEITGCPNLEFFPKRGLRTMKLTSMLISKCTNLKSLPTDLKRFTSLLSCHINKCPKVEDILSYDDGDEGFPTSLLTLCISSCQKLNLCRLDNLHNLHDLEIKGDIKSFPINGLPPYLHSLRISECKNLRTLMVLPNLGMLEISGCDKLESLPDEGLPSSLFLLRINGCPIWKEKIARKDLVEWFKIDDIQLVVIDGEELLR